MRRRTLQPGEVLCAHCRRPLLKVAAAVFAGEALHPIGCFDAALKKRKATLATAMKRAGFER